MWFFVALCQSEILLWLMLFLLRVWFQAQFLFQNQVRQPEAAMLLQRHLVCLCVCWLLFERMGKRGPIRGRCPIFTVQHTQSHHAQMHTYQSEVQWTNTCFRPFGKGWFYVLLLPFGKTPLQIPISGFRRRLLTLFGHFHKPDMNSNMNLAYFLKRTTRVKEEVALAQQIRSCYPKLNGCGSVICDFLRSLSPITGTF